MSLLKDRIADLLPGFQNQKEGFACFGHLGGRKGLCRMVTLCPRTSASRLLPTASSILGDPIPLVGRRERWRFSLTSGPVEKELRGCMKREDMLYHSEKSRTRRWLPKLHQGGLNAQGLGPDSGPTAPSSVLEKHVSRTPWS